MVSLHTLSQARGFRPSSLHTTLRVFSARVLEVDGAQHTIRGCLYGYETVEVFLN